MLAAQIVHETLDGETVVINLASGTYFSLEGSACDLWARLLAGEPAETSAAQLAALHGADEAAVLQAIGAFYDELSDAGLVSITATTSEGAAGELGSFSAPKLRAYTDLREHLLLDPVHDVERGAGWPAVST